MQILSTVTNGKLSPYAREMIVRTLAQYEGMQIEIFITEPTKKRSTRQNRMLWAFYKPMSDYTGYTEEELHELMKAEFIGVETFHVGENVFLRPKTSTRLTTKGFTKFLEKIMFIAEFLGIDYQEKLENRYPDEIGRM